MAAPPLQDVIALASVAASGLYLVRGTWRSLRGKPAGLGSCCSRGCQSPATAATVTHIVTHMVPANQLAARALAARSRRDRG